MNREIRKYLLYGAGEIVLIIIGILIALQIDNWNTERQQEDMLKTYLQAIAGNMQDDAAELRELRDIRSARIFDASRAASVMGRTDYEYDVAEVYFFNKVAADASENLYFNADTSSFAALNASSVGGRLQGRDIGRVLSKYYDQVSHIEDLEERLNDLLNDLNREFLLSHPGNIAQWEFREPRALSTDRFRDMQPQFSTIINGAAVREMVNLQVEASSIIREYDRLEQLGKAFIALLESGHMSFKQPQTASILNAGKIPDSAHYADLVTDGQVNAQFYILQKVAEGFEPIFKFHSIEIVDGSLRLAYPGSDSWAAIWLGVLDVQEDRPTLDFSRFDKLVLELRADTDGTAVSVHLKDRFLPDTEAPQSTTLQITDTWHTYEIDLKSFDETDLSKLITPLGFTFDKQAQSFRLRNARYKVTD